MLGINVRNKKIIMLNYSIGYLLYLILQISIIFVIPLNVW